MDYSACRCVKKIPEKERPFLQDQRGSRLAHLGGVDQKATRKMQKKQLEQAKKQKTTASFDHSLPSTSQASQQPHNQDQLDDSCEGTQDISSDSDCCSDDEDSSDEEFVPSRPGNRTLQNRMDILPVALECLRGGVSCQVGARIATAALECAGVVTPENRQYIIDRSKVERAVTKSMDYCKILARTRQTPLVCLSFDGKRDYTRVFLEEEDGHKRAGEVKEEHIVMVQQPDNVYLSHVTVSVSLV